MCFNKKAALSEMIVLRLICFYVVSNFEADFKIHFKLICKIKECFVKLLSDSLIDV